MLPRLMCVDTSLLYYATKVEVQNNMSLSGGGFAGDVSLNTYTLKFTNVSYAERVFNQAKFASDATCLLCAPYSDAAGCGGVGPNWVNEWYTGPTGPLTRKAANFTKPMGLTVSDITNSNVAGVGGTIILRLIIGPFAEQYGVRLAVTFILVVTCIPGFLAAREYCRRSFLSPSPLQAAAAD